MGLNRLEVLAVSIFRALTLNRLLLQLAIRRRAGVGVRRIAASAELDADRLALRLRLGDDWKEVLGAASKDVSEAHAVLVASGGLEANQDQASAAAALTELPQALTEARKAKSRWDAEQERLTAQAQEAAHRVTPAQRRQAAEWTSSMLNRTPSTPSAPEMIGPVCWLRLGPPPAMKPAGCYLFGTVGTGKSTVMDLFCLTTLQGWRVRRQHFHEFALWLHQHLHRLRSTAEPQRHILERVADEVAEGIDLLCLDELAVTNVADAAVLTELLQLLAVRHVAVVCTTNRPPEDLYKDGLHRERYLPALVSHIRDNLLVQGVTGRDYRAAMHRAEFAISEASGPAVFFEEGEAEEALDQALGTEKPQLAPGAIKVSWGRSLPVPGLGDGMAQFHFDDLCRKPLAAEDYLILATKFHTLFVHDVPRLTLEEHNEARRFTNLVDALYEHSVRLICHSNGRIEEVLRSIEVLQKASQDEEFDADRLGVFETMYDDSPNFQIQIKELGSRERWKELQDRRMAEEQQHEAQRLRRLGNVDAAEGDTGSFWSAAPASADLSAPDQGVAGVMVAAVGSLQESGFAARRAASRLKEMQTSTYLEAARRRRESFGSLP
ncbi:Afg1l [Symbiodinium natans]|uniref:Afg1l protein n=1 Tax=Symbiodinium natans TaxID=878477 RepID=A0A812PHB6_9DINO|nr:Afg1l [Symbiodinium natans]